MLTAGKQRARPKSEHWEPMERQQRQYLQPPTTSRSMGSLMSATASAAVSGCRDRSPSFDWETMEGGASSGAAFTNAVSNRNYYDEPYPVQLPVPPSKFHLRVDDHYPTSCNQLKSHYPRFPEVDVFISSPPTSDEETDELSKDVPTNFYKDYCDNEGPIHDTPKELPSEGEDDVFVESSSRVDEVGIEETKQCDEQLVMRMKLCLHEEPIDGQDSSNSEQVFFVDSSIIEDIDYAINCLERHRHVDLLGQCRGKLRRPHHRRRCCCCCCCCCRKRETLTKYSQTEIHELMPELKLDLSGLNQGEQSNSSNSSENEPETENEEEEVRYGHGRVASLTKRFSCVNITGGTVRPTMFRAKRFASEPNVWESERSCEEKLFKSEFELCNLREGRSCSAEVLSEPSSCKLTAEERKRVIEQLRELADLDSTGSKPQQPIHKTKPCSCRLGVLEIARCGSRLKSQRKHPSCRARPRKQHCFTHLFSELAKEPNVRLRRFKGSLSLSLDKSEDDSFEQKCDSERKREFSLEFPPLEPRFAPRREFDANEDGKDDFWELSRADAARKTKTNFPVYIDVYLHS